LPCAPRARKGKSKKNCLYGSDPCVSFKRFFCLSERWRLHPNKLGVCSDRIWSLMIGPMRRSLFQLLYSLVHLLLHLQELAQYVGLRCQKCLCRCQGGGEGGSPLPQAPKALKVLRVGLTIWNWVFIKHTFIILLIKLTSRICTTNAHLW
jgi:hypothetical protein